MYIVVFGLGKLGLPLAVLLAERHRVVGIDPAWNGAHSPEPDLEHRYQQVVDDGSLVVHQTILSASREHDFDVAFIVVPTPSVKRTGEYLLSFVLKACEDIKDYDVSDNVVLVSTVSPGDCAGRIQDALGRERALVYSPEFVALGQVLWDMINPDFRLIGCDGAVPTEVMQVLDFGIPGPSFIMSTKEAEIAKLAINTYLTMKISFSNLIAQLCELHPGTNASNVLDVVGADFRIGSSYLHVGGPFAGPCFPRDTRAFAAFAGEFGIELMVAIDDINSNTYWRVLATIEALLALHNVRQVGILGLTYKQDTTVTDESLGTWLKQTINPDTLSVSTWDPLVEGTVLTAYECIGPEMITVLANPDPYWATLQYGRARAVIDVWRVLDSKEDNVYVMGKT